VERLRILGSGGVNATRGYGLRQGHGNPKGRKNRSKLDERMKKGPMGMLGCLILSTIIGKGGEEN